MLKLKHESIGNGQSIEFSIGDDSNLYFRGQLYGLNDTALKQDISSEAHNSAYSIYPSSTKMHNDLK